MTKLNEITLCPIPRSALLGALSAWLVYGFIGHASSANTGFKINVWDQVAQLRLEVPPYMVSYAALCAENDKHPVRILQLVCDKKKYSTTAPTTLAQEN